MVGTDAVAIRIRSTGGPEVLALEPMQLTSPGPGEVLVRHAAVGVNFVDTYYRSGLYEIALPSGLGNEAAGIVEAVGAETTAFRAGDRVGTFTGPLGANATRRLVGEDHLVKLPDSISFVDAAAVMLKGCTAEALIERCAKVRPGQTVLVHAAAGGVGSILVQWLRAIGAQIIAHSSDAAKARLAAESGADHALCCPLPELALEVHRLTGGKGVEIVFDGVGAASWSGSVAAVARRGLIVSYGNASGPVPPISLLELRRAGSLFVTRPALNDYCGSMEERRAAAARLFAMMRDGVVKVRVGQQFELGKAADAHRALESRATSGSTVLVPAPLGGS